LLKALFRYHSVRGGSLLQAVVFGQILKKPEFYAEVTRQKHRFLQHKSPGDYPVRFSEKDSKKSFYEIVRGSRLNVLGKQKSQTSCAGALKRVLQPKISGFCGL
jgi:hypothetical protein